MVFEQIIRLFESSNGFSILNLLIFSILIAIYSVFIWKFYKFLARRNIIYLNLKQYNKTERPLLNKFLHSILFLAEYIIILPIIVLIWFVILSLFLLVLSKQQSVQQIILISAAIVAATRITAYISESLSRDLSKMFPFTILVIFLLDPNFFSLDLLVKRFFEISGFLNNIVFYFVFILIVEFLLRFGYTIIEFIKSLKK